LLDSKKKPEQALAQLKETIEAVLEKKEGSASTLLIAGIGSFFLILFILYFAVRKKKEDSWEIMIPASAKGWERIRFYADKFYIPYLFVMPALLLLVIFLFFPLIVSLVMSFTNWNVYSFNNWGQIHFLGFENYTKLFQERVFWKALANTFIFAGAGVPLTVLVSLFFAVLINEKFVRIKAVFRTGYFIPVVTTLVAVAVIWRWLYNPEYGLINYFLELLRLPRQDWLGNTKLALPSLILMGVWKSFGYNMVIFLAGLQTIPDALYEASDIDGASKWQQFYYITLPSLQPTMSFITIMSFIGYFQFFAEPYIMTKGGPLNSTISVVQYMYNQGFKFFQFGYATSVAYVLFLFIFVFTLLQMKIRKMGEVS
ncbi:MAG TPA: sugar ABC transporter permease, partial [bacterium]|nr:sugar ABC transporter permease [bacterium]